VARDRAPLAGARRVIPRLNIIAWSANAPWAELRQVEQDLIISRALVDLFREPQLAAELRFRGGTALHKLHFPKPLRYSEDIDLVRSVGGPIGPLIDTVRKILEPWLGAAAIAQTDSATKLRFRTPAEDDSGDIRLKIEINTRERDAFDPPEHCTMPSIVPGTPDEPISLASRMKNSWRPSSAPCSSATRDATCSIFFNPWRLSTGLTYRAL
jgi:hypothetical protein